MNKNTFLRFVLITLFCLGAFANLNHIYGIKKDIKLDINTKTIIAREATDYVWYLNGTQIKNTGRTVKVSTAGVYEVKMTIENGEVVTARISVGINADGEAYTIFLIGDSTVCYYSSGDLVGWGMMLPYFFDSSVEIVNKAVSGTSAKSFYNDANLWPKVIAEVDSGDYVFIGFGINDNQSTYPAKYTLPFAGFRDYLILYIEETQAKGAFPVLVTPTQKNSFINDSTLEGKWGNYPVASRRLADSLGLPLIDVDSVTKPLCISLGYDYLHNFVYYTDDTHFQEAGAVEMARVVAQEISRYTDNDTMNLLINHLKPLYKVATSTNFPELATITRTASYPEGIPVNLKAKYSNDTLDLLEWQYAEDGSTFAYMATSDDYRFTMGTDSLDLLAFIDDDPEPDCWGTLNGSAYIDDCGDCVGGTTTAKPCNKETSEGIYKFTSVRSELCVQGGETTTQEDCLDEGSQYWQLIKDGDFYKIKNYSTGQFLGYSELVSNTEVTLDTSEVLWRMEKIGTDTFEFFLADSASLGLEIAYGSTKAGKSLVINYRSNATKQQFILGELAPSVAFDDIAENDLNITIVPNPANGQAVLELSSVTLDPVSFELFNLQGKRVFKQTNITGNTYEFGYELSKGIYVAKVMSGQGVCALKFIKY